MCVWGKLAEERISNMRTVRAFGKDLSEVRAYRQKTDEVFSLAKKEAVIRAGFYGVVSVCDLIVDTKYSITILPFCVPYHQGCVQKPLFLDIWFVCTSFKKEWTFYKTFLSYYEGLRCQSIQKMTVVHYRGVCVCFRLASAVTS